MTGGRGLETWYNGKTLTIASHPHKVFAQAPMPDTIDRTLDALAERYDMPLPMGDLFYSSAEKALLSDTTTGGYAGTEKVGDTPCYHLAFHDIGSGLGSVAAGAGRPAAEALQGRPESGARASPWSTSRSRPGILRRRSATRRSSRRCRRTTRASPSCSAPRRSRTTRQ